MLSEKKARELLNKFIKNKDRLKHSEMVAEIGFNVAKKISFMHPELKLDPKKVKSMGLLHDIGRGEKLRKTGFHPLDGKIFLESIGEKELGEKIATHSVASEAAGMQGIKGDFKPKTLEEKILTYADMHSSHDGRKVSFEERIKGIRERYRAINPRVMESILRAEKRLKRIEGEIEQLFVG